MAAEVGEGFYHRKLMCFVLSMNYEWATRSLCLILPPQNCTDMTGAIAFATAIDPRVKMIVTACQNPSETECVLDTTYRRTPQGWVADPPPTQPVIIRTMTTWHGVH